MLACDVSPDGNFFAAGGDSLKAVDVVARLNERLGSTLDYIDVFDCPTPAELAALLARQRGAAP